MIARKTSTTLVAVLLAYSMGVSTTMSQSITLNSGIDSNSDGFDDLVRFLAGPQDSGFASPFALADFTAAQSGPAALVLTSLAAWNTPNGATDPLAKWISTDSTPNNGTGSALYAVPFTLAFDDFVTLDFSYAIDNGLGDPVNQGLFVNGVAITGYGIANPTQFDSVTTLPTIDITSLVNVGTNYLYIYQYDWGSAAGAQFTAEVYSLPSPTALAALTVGALFGGSRRRKC